MDNDLIAERMISVSNDILTVADYGTILGRTRALRELAAELKDMASTLREKKPISLCPVCKTGVEAKQGRTASHFGYLNVYHTVCLKSIEEGIYRWSTSP